MYVQALLGMSKISPRGCNYSSCGGCKEQAFFSQVTLKEGHIDYDNKKSRLNANQIPQVGPCCLLVVVPRFCLDSSCGGSRLKAYICTTKQPRQLYHEVNTDNQLFWKSGQALGGTSSKALTTT